MWAQPASRTATTAEALTLYPLFFHGRQVVVRGTIQHPSPDVTSLRAGDNVRPVFLFSRSGMLDEGAKEIRGEFWDLGRLTADDPRLAGLSLEPFLARVSEELGDAMVGLETSKLGEKELLQTRGW